MNLECWKNKYDFSAKRRLNFELDFSGTYIMISILINNAKDAKSGGV